MTMPQATADDVQDGRQRNRLPPLLSLMRPHQWVKNAFVAAPLFFTPDLVGTDSALRMAGGVACFCAVSSAVYILNDFMDRTADRQHPAKRHRPLAAGTVTVAMAMTALAILAVCGLLGAFIFGTGFGMAVLSYAVMNLAYSLGLKNVAILDILIIAMGFVIRVEAGALLLGIMPSVWIIVCTGMLALFLAIAKRRDDVVRTLDASHRKSLKGYNLPFLDAALTAVLAATFMSYALYTTDQTVMERLGSQQLYFTLPWVMAGILRYLQITMVEERSGSPTRIVLSDPFIGIVTLGWLATFAFLIY